MLSTRDTDRRNSNEEVHIVFHGKDIKDGESLRNVNSFEYLKEIAASIPTVLLKKYPELRAFKAKFYGDENIEIDYSETTKYGEIYTSFLSNLQKIIPEIGHDQEARFGVLMDSGNKMDAQLFDELNDIDRFVDLLYANHNRALSRSAEFAKSGLDGESDISPRIEKKILNRSIGHTTQDTLFETVQKDLKYGLMMFQPSPHGEEHPMTRFKATFIDDTYQPMLRTSIPSVRTYEHHQYKQHFPTECRFGTQGEFIEKIPRINPIFPVWLKAQERKRVLAQLQHGNEEAISKGVTGKSGLEDSQQLSEIQIEQSSSGNFLMDEIAIDEEVDEPKKTRISHIYFNNLGLDRTDGEGKKERALTLQLHDLEYYNRNLAVITLPADKGLLSHDMLGNNSGKTSLASSAYQRMLTIATIGSKLKTVDKEYSDFFISNDIKQLLYGEPTNNSEAYNINAESDKMRELLGISIHKLGLDDKEYLTNAEIQAVYFHFIKFEVTNFIITKLNPDSINFTCKDAIDRGGVSSLYFNLVKSIEIGKPMSEEEFFEALHGAPTMVKGRGMNHHLERVWNAICAYVDGQKQNPDIQIPGWLIEKKQEYENSRLIDVVLETYAYKHTGIGKTVTLSTNDYMTYTSSENHNKLNEATLGAVKASISVDFVNYVETLRSGKLTQDQVIAGIRSGIERALDQSKCARSNGKGGYHSTGTLEKELGKISERLDTLDHKSKLIQ